MPIPGSIDDRAEIVPWAPADRAPGQVIVSDERWRVTYAPPVFYFKISDDDALDSVNKFLDRCSISGPEIEGGAGALFQEILDSACVRVREVQNVDEIAHAGSSQVS